MLQPHTCDRPRLLQGTEIQGNQAYSCEGPWRSQSCSRTFQVQTLQGRRGYPRSLPPRTHSCLKLKKKVKLNYSPLNASSTLSRLSSTMALDGLPLCSGLKTTVMVLEPESCKHAGNARQPTIIATEQCCWHTFHRRHHGGLAGGRTGGCTYGAQHAVHDTWCMIYGT